MATVNEVYGFLDKLAPFDLQMDFDNAGFLVGRGETQVKRLLVALDVTLPVAKEAAEKGCQLIVSHHPVIFHPVKALTDQSATGRVLLALAEGRMAAICAHTNLAAVMEGVTCCLARPLELGAGVVVLSATKYLNGHGDVIAGFVVGSAEFCTEVRMFGLKDMTGAVMDPFTSFLILRGLKTLEIRMQKHCANAKAVAEFLYNHPAVEKVYYPGLIDHPGHDIARRQMSDFGGMLSFEVKGGREAGAKLVNALHLITVAVSLGDAETLIEHPASMTHSTYSEEELAASGIAAGLIRLSAGLENAEDIIADLKQALAQL